MNEPGTRVRLSLKVAKSPQVEGMVLADKYRLTGLLGRGGMGSVWRAEHLSLNSSVAVKLVDSTLADHPEAKERFLREAQAAAALRSPHVVQILDYGVQDDTPFIVMEMLEGEDLATRLSRVGKLSPSSTAEVLVQVCRAVGRAHDRGIVHRDLKPDNIFLSANDDTEIAKVLDFGVAKRVQLDGPKSMTQTGAVLGTPYYMSPEQAEGSRNVGFRSDLWALGVIAFECLTGQRPFDADSLGGLVLAICTKAIPVPSSRGKVPAGFDEWFEKATSRDPDLRFGSARELASSLQALCSGGRSALSSVADDGVVAPLVTGNADRDPSNALAAGRQGSRLGHTSAAGALARSSLEEDDKVQLPLSHGGAKVLWAAAAVVGVLGLAAVVWRLTRSPDPGASASAGSTAAALTAPPAPASESAQATGDTAPKEGSIQVLPVASSAPLLSATAPPASSPPPAAHRSSPRRPGTSNLPKASAPPKPASSAKTTSTPVKPNSATSNKPKINLGI